MKNLLQFIVFFQAITLGLTGDIYAQIQVGQDIDGEYWSGGTGYSVSMPDAFTVAVGTPWKEGNTSYAGHVRVYKWNGNVWMQKGPNIDGEATGDNFGISVSMPDSNTLAIGANFNGGTGYRAGHVRIFHWNGVSWIQKGLDIDGEAGNDESGFSISMPDSNTVAIGAQYNDGSATSAGHVRIYRWNGGAWIQKGMDIDGAAVVSESGNSVCMPDTNTVAIGAWREDGPGTDAGHVRIYQWSGSTWVQKGLDIAGEASDDVSGFSISMPDASTIAIGAPRNDGNGFKSGHVRIYQWNGSDWMQKGVDIDGEKGGDHCGNSVSMPDSNTVAIGAQYNDGSATSAGHVRIYRWNGSIWLKNGVSIDGEAQGDQSGFSVSMPNSNTIAIGAHLNKGNWYNSNRAGHVRIYTLNGIYGYVYNDLNQNCTKESLEIGVVKGIRGIIMPGNITVETSESGQWKLDSLNEGVYTITYDTTKGWLSSCSNTQTFTITNQDSGYYLPPFGMYNSNPCTKPDVSIIIPRIRPCFTNQGIHIRACNSSLASGILYNGYVLVELDSLITPSSSSIPFTKQGYSYRFEVGNIYPGRCVDFKVDATVSCDAILGQTLCMEANLFPIDSCVLDTIPANTPPDFTPCDQPWDKSSISVDGWCENDSIYFTITNSGDIGTGNMQCFSPIRLYIDGQYLWLDSIQLTGQEIDTLIFSGDGRTWRLEVDQHPLHPGSSNPNATIELCGNDSNWTSDLVNVLPHDDLDPITDIYCGVVTGSYDPNDKSGYPLGTTDSHFVVPNGKMEYVIRFQNTGTDMANKVVVRDTLDTNLNVFSVKSGVSSHDYEFKMYGPRVLEWTFNDIFLADSGADYEGSNGFVSFSVVQNPNLSDGTEINNEAAIYFDYNAPVITNLTSHVVKRKIQTPLWTNQTQVVDTSCNPITLNEKTYSISGTYYQFKGDTLLELQLSISNLALLVHATEDSPCVSDSIILNGSGAQNYIWDNGVLNGQPFIPIDTNTYHVIGIDPYGCQDMDSITIRVNPLPVVIAHVSDSSICMNDSVMFTGSGAQIYIWDNGVLDGKAFMPSNSNTYHVVGIDSLGCQDVDSMEVIVKALPIVNIHATDSSICINDSVALTASGTPPYSWDNGVIDGQRFAPLSTQTYNVQGTDSLGCVGTKSIQIVVNPLPTVLANTSDYSPCEKETVTLFGSGAKYYIWDQGVLNGQAFIPNDSNTYYVVGVDSLGCQDIDSIFITINPLPVVSANVSDSSICLNDSVVLSGSGAQSYVWDNGVIDNVGFRLDSSQTYHVTGTDSNGCIGSDSIFIKVYDTIPQAEFIYQLTGFEITMLDSSSRDVNSWFWTVDVDSISETNAGHYEFTENGTYELCLIASNDCFSDTICKEITISGVGIEHRLEEGDITVYPNPTSQQLNFNIKNVKVTSIRIMDLSGRVLDYHINTNSNQYVIDVSSFDSGMYFYELRNNEEIVGIGEFIKK